MPIANPLYLVTGAIRAVEAGETVDLGAVRTQLTARFDQIAAVARDVPDAGIDVFAGMAEPLLEALDALVAGDLEAARAAVGRAFQQFQPPEGENP